MNNLKLGVEVISAHNFMAKDDQGSSSPFVELYFDHQRFRTTVKEKDLDPVWHELFYFNISDPNNLPKLTLEIYVYNNIKNTNSKSFLGKVCIRGTTFVPYSDSVTLHYPLGKKGILSRVKGEIGLKVYITNDPSVRSSNPLPAMESSLMDTNSVSTKSQTTVERVANFFHNTFHKEKKDTRNMFHHLPKSSSVQPAQAAVEKMRAVESISPRVVQMFPGSSSQPVDFSIKETSPFLGGGRIVGGRVIRGNKPTSTYDFVEPITYLFVQVVKARDLPSKDLTGNLDPYVEVRLGNYIGITRHFNKNQKPEWNVVFTFLKDSVQSFVLDVMVKDKDMLKDDIVGIVRIDLHEVPTRVLPDSSLAPEWYRLSDEIGEKKKGEIMLAVWFGTQADESFPDAWHSDAARQFDGPAGLPFRSKVYHSPRLWYFTVNVIEAQDLVLAEKTRLPYVNVKAQVGNQVLRTKSIQSRTMNELRNEDLVFVVAEPFEDYLILSIEASVGPDRNEVLGEVMVPLTSVEKRADDRIVQSRWLNLQKPSSKLEEPKKEKFAIRVHLRICLDGGYHVLDESTHYSSDLRPTAKQLWKPSIGTLELGILSADALQPMKSRDGHVTTDSYCVSKYGHKWVRSRTVIDCLNPKFNEQYTWEVYDPATVLTVGVFNNSLVCEKNPNNHKDVELGKVRIRISTLETGRVYTHWYPLLVLNPSGVKKTGELHLAIRFSCTSMVNMMYLYSRPLLPKMHYVKPLSSLQLDMLRLQAVNIVAARLSRAEPPLRKEVIQYMIDANFHLWSTRKNKAGFFRLMSVFNGLFAVTTWFGDVCLWKNPVTTVLVHVLFIMLVLFRELILPAIFLFLSLIGVWNYRFRPKSPLHMNTRLSFAEAVNPDELDEEFDNFPSIQNPETIRKRYDHLRSVAGQIQTVVGDIASQGERVQALLSWQDPRATFIFLTFCLVFTFVLYAIPIEVMILVAGFYLMRHPRFRHKLPSAPINFFLRLPARTDSML